MKTIRDRKQEKAAEASSGSAQGKVQRLNRKQRRELVRKIQADDVSLEVVHPDAAGIDVGNEYHYVAVPQAGSGATGTAIRGWGRWRDLTIRSRRWRGLRRGR